MSKVTAREGKKDSAEPKRRGRPAKPRAMVEFKDGLAGVAQVETVRISEIDLEDRRFQYRVREKLTDLRDSLAREGQLVPVILWGKEPPYKIVDGYRRTAAVRSLGWDTVRAIVRRDITEDDAYRLSFVENVKRKNFTPVDMANAIWKAQVLRHKSDEELRREFDLSERHLRRFKQVIEFPEPIKDALAADGSAVTMAHALVLHSFGLKDIAPWVERIEEGLSAQALKRVLTKDMGEKRTPKLFFRKEADGFRLFPMRFSSSLPVQEREKLLGILEKAVEIAKGQLKKSR